MSEKKTLDTATPSLVEVAAINNIISLLSSREFTFEQALGLLPHLEVALKELSARQIIKTECLSRQL